MGKFRKVVKEAFNAVDLIGNARPKGKEHLSLDVRHDADCNQLQAVLSKRLKDKRDSFKKEDGELWELETEIELDFECQRYFVDKDGKETDGYYIDGNKKGLNWAFFWLNGMAKPPPPKKTRGKKIGNVADASL